MSRAALLRRPVRFGLVGLVNTVAGFTVIMVARWYNYGEVLSNLLGYVCGLFLSFSLHRHWTFVDRNPLPYAAVRFLTVVAAAWSPNILLVLSLLRVGFPEALAHAAGLILYSALTYIGCRYWAFEARTERL